MYKHRTTDVVEIAQSLGLKRYGQEWRGACPSCGYGKEVFSLKATSTGNAFYYCHAGCTYQELKGLISSDRKIYHSRVMKKPEDKRKASASLKHQAYIQRLWAESQPASGTIAQRYLKTRGLNGNPPSSLRFHPRLKHTLSKQYFPVLLAKVTGPGGQSLKALHRTFLKPDGSGKADVMSNKRMLGNVTGYSVHLSEPSNGELIICEGIETGLAVQQATGLATWAALSWGGIANLELPPIPDVSSVIVAADADDDGQGLYGAKKAAKRWRLLGYKVKISLPPKGLDFLDLLEQKEVHV